MKKFVFGFLALMATSAFGASPFGFGPVIPGDEPIANIFALVTGLFACAVALTVGGQSSDMTLARAAANDGSQFGGGVASGRW